ncbi:hypothetical protein GCM10009864_26560 [Streptomyces lunalinharesii]|uniref:Uncharacterized protein n=1 Tax=Streptomyces lunalinharesii TaxID=333384 RepID=A0ABP6E2Q0_9ACTN
MNEAGAQVRSGRRSSTAGFEQCPGDSVTNVVAADGSGPGAPDGGVRDVCARRLAARARAAARRLPKDVP